MATHLRRYAGLQSMCTGAASSLDLNISNRFMASLLQQGISRNSEVGTTSWISPMRGCSHGREDFLRPSPRSVAVLVSSKQ